MRKCVQLLQLYNCPPKVPNIGILIVVVNDSCKVVTVVSILKKETG